MQTEIEILNTDYHKQIVKQRNQVYNEYVTRFNKSIKEIMYYFNNERQEEHRFNNYWAENLKEITQKHI